MLMQNLYPPRRRISSPLLGALGIFLGLLLVAFFMAPRVERVAPTPDAAGVPGTAPVEIRFSRPMDKLSVEARFQLEPEIAGRLEWEGNTLIFHPLQRWPRGRIVQVRLQMGARSTSFLPILRSHEWAFTAGEPRVLYLWPADGLADIYAVAFKGGPPERLTEATYGVQDFNIHPLGAELVYTAFDEGGETSLRQLNLVNGEDQLLYRCPPGYHCQNPRLSPDYGFLAFERYRWEAGAGGRAVPGAARVWVLETGVEAEPVLVGRVEGSSLDPLWSVKGDLAYYDSGKGSIVVARPQDDPEALPRVEFPSNLGQLGGWSPEGDALLYPDIIFQANSAQGEESTESGVAAFYSHIYRGTISTGSVVDLSGSGLQVVEDASPVYSPDGERVAFARKFLDNRWTLGRQLWIMSADGSSPRPLTDEADYNHSAISWHPEGSAVLYMRFNQADPEEPAEIWITELENGDSWRLVEGGYLPAWIP